MGALLSNAKVWLSGVYSSLLAAFGSSQATGAAQRNLLIFAMIIVVIFVLVLLGVLALLPSQRKVVRKRTVRRVRRKITSEEQPVEAAAVVAAAEPVSPEVTRNRRRVGLIATIVVLAVLVVGSFVAVYIVTGSNSYCGTTCHAKNSHVVVAVKTPHAKCIDCHEAGPISGSISRIRMAMAQAIGQPTVVSMPVDPNRCLKCHGDVTSATLKTKTGLIVSHKEILAAGRTCSDCHPNTGHTQNNTIAAGMSQCTSCHDGKTAKATCETCHVGGSPITAASPIRKAVSAFDYGPAVRVANRQCERCHGDEKECIACHGLVLPHSAAFVSGGHARMAAFSGKDMCMKCHTLAWCGSGKCHNSFSAHSTGTWNVDHQTGTSEQCGSCHIAWDGKGSFCKVCH